MKAILPFLASAALLSANPPRYAITAHTLHSGGVMTGGGGRFTLSATAGQPEAVPQFLSSDQRYALAPGFWPAAVVIAVPGAPPLRFLPAPQAHVILAWPVASSGWVLEQSANLLTWTPVEIPVVNTAADHTVTLPTSSGPARRFFRLRCL